MLVAGVLAASALLVAAPAGATNYSAYCPGDSGNLQNLIDNAGSGDTITIYGTCYGNYTIDGSNINNYGQLTLQGGSAGATLNGRGTGTTLSIYNSANVTIRNLTITNGYGGAGGGIDVVESDLTMTNATVAWNRADFGGGIWAASSVLDLTGVTVTWNRASYQGGGIGMLDGELTMTASTVSRNKVTSSGLEYGGGGIWIGGGNALVTSTRVTANTSADYGGGIADYGACRILFAPPIGAQGIFCGLPPAGTAGGRLVGSANATDGLPSGLTLIDSSVDHNIASDHGGGIYNESTYFDSPVTLEGTTVSFNNALDGDGGGIYNYGVCGWTASLLATSSSFQGNQARKGEGGAVYNATGGVELCVVQTSGAGSGSTVTGRTAIADSTALVTVAQSPTANGPNVVNANQAMYGGGFANEQDEFGIASLTLQPGATVRGNKASVTGGGVWNSCGSFSSLAQIFLNTPNNVVSGCF